MFYWILCNSVTLKYNSVTLVCTAEKKSCLCVTGHLVFCRWNFSYKRNISFLLCLWKFENTPTLLRYLPLFVADNYSDFYTRKKLIGNFELLIGRLRHFAMVKLTFKIFRPKKGEDFGSYAFRKKIPIMYAARIKIKIQA